MECDCLGDRIAETLEGHNLDIGVRIRQVHLETRIEFPSFKFLSQLDAVMARDPCRPSYCRIRS